MDRVDQLLLRVRAWRAVAPFGRWFEVFCRPSASGTTWMVGAWQIVGADGEVRAVVHHADRLETALERTVTDIEAGVDSMPKTRASPWRPIDPFDE